MRGSRNHDGLLLAASCDDISHGCIYVPLESGISLNKQMGLILTVALCFILGVALVNNFRSQSDTRQQLDALKQQVNEQKRATDAVAHSEPVSTSGVTLSTSSPLPTEYAERHARILQVMDSGWKLINLRSPARAKDAADLFEAGIEKIDSKSPDLYNGLGRALLIEGKPVEAINAWREGLQLAPKFSDMQSGMGWAYWRLGDYCRARKCWDAAVLIDPKSIDAWSALAWIDLAMGKQTESKLGFQALVAHDDKSRMWIMGLSMAQANNRDISQISGFFNLPPLEMFDRVIPDPAAPAADTMSAATQQ